MIELLILFCILNRELTMYGIQKEIYDKFGAYTKPSFGALKPALRRLEKSGFLQTRRSMTEGGKQSGFYAITNDGMTELKRLLNENLSANPLHFFSNARIKLSCASYLSKEEAKELFFNIKHSAMEHKYSAENALNGEGISLTFYQRVVMDNAICEFQNLISLIENLEKELS